MLIKFYGQLHQTKSLSCRGSLRTLLPSKVKKYVSKSKKLLYTFLFMIPLNINKISGVAPSDQQSQLQKYLKGWELWQSTATLEVGEELLYSVCMTSRTIFWPSWMNLNF